jgi:hypothetical protein
VDSEKDNFFTRERQIIILGRKKVTIGGMGDLSVKFSDVVPETKLNAGDVIGSDYVLREERYSERQFCELRESMLEL